MKTIKGDILTIDRGIIVHGCNSHGVFGAGIALQIKKQFPDVFKTYARSNLTLGHITYLEVAESKYIVNAITQQSTGIGKQISYDAIEDCFTRVVQLHKILSNKPENKDLPICFPLIGAGLGGGNWNIIEKIISETIPSDIETILYVL